MKCREVIGGSVFSETGRAAPDCKYPDTLTTAYKPTRTAETTKPEIECGRPSLPHLQGRNANSPANPDFLSLSLFLFLSPSTSLSLSPKLPSEVSSTRQNAVSFPFLPLYDEPNQTNERKGKKR